MIKTINNFTVACDNCGAEIEQMVGAEYSSFGDPETAVEYAESIGLTVIDKEHYCNGCFVGDVLDEDRKGCFEPVPLDVRFFPESGCLPPEDPERVHRSKIVGVNLMYRKERLKGYYDYLTKQWFLTVWNDDWVKACFYTAYALGVDANIIMKVYSEVKRTGKFTNQELRYMTGLGFPVIRELANMQKIAYEQVNMDISHGLVDFRTFRKMLIRSTSEGGIFHQVSKARRDHLKGALQNEYYVNPSEEVNSWFYIEKQ